MKIKYEGPRQLKSMVETVCNKVAGDYDRQDVHIAVSPILDPRPSVKDVAKIYKEISTHIAKFEGVLKKPKSERRTRIIEQSNKKIKTYSFVDGSNTEIMAMFKHSEDILYLDPLFTSIHYLALLNGGSQSPYDLDNLVKHELVHNDIAKSNVRTAMTQVQKPGLQFNEFIARTKNLKGDKFQKWFASAEGRRFCDFARELLEEDISAIGADELFEVTGRTLQERISGAESVFMGLHLEVAEEALAYNFETKKSGFLAFVKHRYGDLDITRAEALYELIEREMKTNSRVETLRMVKSKMEKSFSDEVSVLDLFGV